jgi:hypothetical protein
MRVVDSQIFGHDLKCEGVSLGSNLGRHSTNGRLTTAPIDDSGGATAAPLARRPGGYGEPFSMRFSPMGAARDGELT